MINIIRKYLLCIILLFLSSCGMNKGIDNSLPIGNEKRVIAREDSINKDKSNIFLYDEETKNETYLMTLKNIDNNHYHVGEYVNKHLYIIRRIGYDGYPDDDWQDELWKYDLQGNGSKLFSNKGIDFRVSPNDQIIALHYLLEGYDYLLKNYRLQFITTSGDKIIEFAGNQLGRTDEDVAPDPGEWSRNSDEYWGYLSFTAFRRLLFRINIRTWHIESYSLNGVPIGEFDLNPNTGKIVCSDHPIFFDVGSRDNFIASKRAVILYLYDLKTKEFTSIATSITKHFSPKWISDSSFKYNNPNGEGSIVYTIDE